MRTLAAPLPNDGSENIAPEVFDAVPRPPGVLLPENREDLFFKPLQTEDPSDAFYVRPIPPVEDFAVTFKVKPVFEPVAPVEPVPTPLESKAASQRFWEAAIPPAGSPGSGGGPFSGQGGLSEYADYAELARHSQMHHHGPVYYALKLSAGTVYDDNVSLGSSGRRKDFQSSIVPAARVVKLDQSFDDRGVLIALAATAYHAIAGEGATIPELIIGHGIVGRLIARIAVALGAEAPIVWEKNTTRRDGALGYTVVDPSDDPRRDYHAICDASGDPSLLDTLIARLAKRGEITLAGFYETPLSFTFPPAFMREARFRVAAEWTRTDIDAVMDLILSGKLSLEGLVTNHATPHEAPEAYRTAFTDPTCLKMILDWREAA